MRRRKRRKQRKIIIISSLTLLFIMTVGYAAFQTNINITAKGNIKKMTAAQYLRTKVTTSGDGLYKDTYESGRYIYKGANPNNYITFNNETWRIISVEVDGSLKILKKDMLPARVFDSKGHRDSTSNGAGGTYCAQLSYGCNAWATTNNFVNGNASGTVLKDAELNIYLNDNTAGADSYYNNSLNSTAKELIQWHTWGIGGVIKYNTDLAAQIAIEKSITWAGNIGLISASDAIRANTNIEQCGNFKLHYDNMAICKNTNYLVPVSSFYWIISPYSGYSHLMCYVHYNGSVDCHSAFYGGGVAPSVYLISNITLKGEGTSKNPYIIVPL